MCITRCIKCDSTSHNQVESAFWNIYEAPRSLTRFISIGCQRNLNDCIKNLLVCNVVPFHLLKMYFMQILTLFNKISGKCGMQAKASSMGLRTKEWVEENAYIMKSKDDMAKKNLRVVSFVNFSASGKWDIRKNEHLLWAFPF